MTRSRRLLRPLVAAAMGFAAYLLVTRVAGCGNLASAMLSASPLLIAAAIGVRLAVPYLHALELYLAARAIGLGIRQRYSYKVVCASLGTEYVVPIGGFGELVKIYGVVRGGAPLRHALVAVLLQRLAASLAVASLGIAAALLLRLGGAIALLVAASWGVVAVNAALLAGVGGERSWRGLARLSERFAPRWLRELVERGGQAPRLSPVWVGVLVAVAVLERIAIIASGYLTAASIGLLIPLPLAVLLFDTLYSIVWVLPMVTPGQLGILETLQLMLMKLSGIGGAASAALPLLSRVVVTVAEAPQYLLFFSVELYSAVKLIEAEGYEGLLKALRSPVVAS